MGEEATANRPELKDWRPTSDPRIKRRYNGQLYARFTKLGIRVEQRLHETNMRAAKEACDRIEELIGANRGLPPNVIRQKVRELFGEEAPPTERPLLIGELWPRFIAFRKAGSKKHKIQPWRAKTLLEYESFWERSFKPFWEFKLPSEIEPNWEAFIAAERRRSSRGMDLTLACQTKYMNGFTSFLVLDKVLPAKPLIWNPDPEKGEHGEEGEDGAGIVIPDDVGLKLLRHSRGAFGLFVRMAALHGMRSSEITQIKKNRLDLRNGVIRLRPIDVKTGSKTKKGRLVPIHRAVLRRLRAQIKVSGDSPYLFPNQRDRERPMDPTGFYGQWYELRTTVGMPEITPHDLRHTYATKIFSNPHVNPVLACKALGMSMQTAERVYIHFDEKHLGIVSQNFTFKAPPLPGMKK